MDAYIVHQKNVLEKDQVGSKAEAVFLAKSFCEII